MDLFSFPPLAAALDAAYAVVMWLTAVIEPIGGAASAALAVAVLTLLVRTALIPAGIAQAKGEQTRARLAPKLRDLQKRFAKSPERLRRETMQLYSDEGTSPFAGCVSILVQAPVVGLVYSLFLHGTIAGHPNGLLTEQLLGVPLGASAVGGLAAGTLTGTAVVVFGAIVVVLIAVGEVSRRVFRMPASADPVIPGIQWLGVLQFATAVVALFVPLAAAIYLTVTSVWTLAQRWTLRRIYPLPA